MTGLVQSNTTLPDRSPASFRTSGAAPRHGQQHRLGLRRVAHRADGRLHLLDLGPLPRVVRVADAEDDRVARLGPPPAEDAAHVAHSDHGDAHSIYSKDGRNAAHCKDAPALKRGPDSCEPSRESDAVGRGGSQTTAGDGPPRESNVNLDDCLPAALRGPAATITPIAAGLSGTGVYRVEAAGQAFVLKVSAEADGEPLDAWRRRVHVQRLAADAGLAPRVVYVDEARRAVVSDFVACRSFSALYGDPRTREAALSLLGRTLRRLHELPLPPGEDAKDPRDLLAALWSGLADFALPVFVGEAVRRGARRGARRRAAPRY